MDSHTPGHPLTGAGRNRTDPRRAKLGGAAEALPVLPFQLSVPWAAKGRASFLSASAVIFHFKAEGKESMSQSWLLSLPPALLPLTPNPQCTLHLPRATPPSPSPSQPPLLWLKGALASWVLTFWKGTWGSTGSWQTGGLLRPWAGRAVGHRPRGLRHRRAEGSSFIQHLLSPSPPVAPLLAEPGAAQI